MSCIEWPFSHAIWPRNETRRGVVPWPKKMRLGGREIASFPALLPSFFALSKNNKQLFNYGGKKAGQ